MSLVPGGAWDCHAHVIGDRARYPLWAGRGYEPPAAPLESYLGLLDRFGVERGVLVQPSVYGYDNRCLLDALEEADGRLLGIVVPAPDSSARDLEAMHVRGARGVRCNILNPGALHPDVVRQWRPVMAELGWHIELHVAVDTISDLRSFIEGFELPVVIDHMGRPTPGRLAPTDDGLRELVDLVGEGACFVKLSAPYRLSARPAPWRDVTPLARAMAAANPAACVWASDWPHTSTEGPVEEGELLDALAEWCPDSSTREVVMAETPRTLFGTG